MNEIDNDNLVINIIREHIRLAVEYSTLPTNGGNTIEDAERITARKAEIKAQIEELRAERIRLYGK